MKIMINTEEYTRVCRLAGLMQAGKTNTWTTEKKEEGIELIQNKIRTFSFKDGERNYDAGITDPRIQNVLGAFEKEIEEQKTGKKEDTKDEVHKTKAEENKIVPETGAIVPDFLTPALMSKWAKMTTTDRILMFQKTPREQIYQVAVGKNPENGKQEFASYVKGNFMFREANAAFLFDWYTELTLSVGAKGVSASGKIFCWFSEYNKYLSRPATGYQETNSRVDTEQAKKGAVTDAIKKGLSLFGFNSDVYSGEV